MTERDRPRLARGLVKQSCFGNYVFSPAEFKSFVLSDTAMRVVKEINGERTIERVAERVARSSNIGLDEANKVVMDVVKLLGNIGVLSFE